jgi:hypothetical protein
MSRRDSIKDRAVAVLRRSLQGGTARGMKIAQKLSKSSRINSEDPSIYVENRVFLNASWVVFRAGKMVSNRGSSRANRDLAV